MYLSSAPALPSSSLVSIDFSLSLFTSLTAGAYLLILYILLFIPALILWISRSLGPPLAFALASRHLCHPRSHPCHQVLQSHSSYSGHLAFALAHPFAHHLALSSSSRTPPLILHNIPSLCLLEGLIKSLEQAADAASRARSSVMRFGRAATTAKNTAWHVTLNTPRSPTNSPPRLLAPPTPQPLEPRRCPRQTHPSHPSCQMPFPAMPPWPDLAAHQEALCRHQYHQYRRPWP